MTLSSKELSKLDYKEAVIALTDMGFMNIRTEALGDMNRGWLYKEGEVKEVSIAGKTNFSVNDAFHKSDEIIIKYHSYPET